MNIGSDQLNKALRLTAWIKVILNNTLYQLLWDIDCTENVLLSLHKRTQDKRLTALTKGLLLI